MSDDDGVIQSAANPRYRRLRGWLDSARERRRDGVTVLEGEHLVDQWLQTGRAVQALVLSQSGAGRAHRADWSTRVAIEPLVLSDRLFATLGSLPSPVPVLAVVTVPAPDGPVQAGVDTVVLDRLQDPANVGAVIRTAAAAGIGQLLTVAGTASCWSPKALRAGMGGQFALRIHEGIDVERIDQALAELALPIAGTLVHRGRSIHATDLRPPCAWVFGHEGEGMSAAIEARIDQAVQIPQSAAVESLNVAAAAAICLFEQRRQRGVGSS